MIIFLVGWLVLCHIFLKWREVTLPFLSENLLYIMYMQSARNQLDTLPRAFDARVSINNVFLQSFCLLYFCPCIMNPPKEKQVPSHLCAMVIIFKLFLPCFTKISMSRKIYRVHSFKMHSLVVTGPRSEVVKFFMFILLSLNVSLLSLQASVLYVGTSC